MQASNDTSRNVQLPAGSSGSYPEVFKVVPSSGGWQLLPSDPHYHPLLAKLFGLEPVGGIEPERADSEDLARTLEWPSLAEGLRLVRGVASGVNLGVRICGSLRCAPTVQLWRKPQVPSIAPRRVFTGLTGDAAKWGVSDFYEAHEQALRAALSSTAAFDTGWYSVKKEVQSGRVRRERPGGSVTIEVSASMDAWPDLIDTAVWAAMGKDLGASCGFDVLLKLGLSQEQAERWLDTAVAQEHEYSDLEDGNSRTAREVLSARIGFDTLCERLTSLVAACEQELHGVYEAVVENCRQKLNNLRVQDK